MSRILWDLTFFTIFLAGTATAAFLTGCELERQAEADPAVKTYTVYNVTLWTGSYTPIRQWQTSIEPKVLSSPPEVTFGGVRIIGGTVLIERAVK